MTQPSQEPLILASTSPYRARLLARLRLPFESVKPDTDETPLAGESGPDLAGRLATSKACSTRHTQGTVIGSDQVAVCRDKILGKPGTAERACQQLAFCAGQRVTFYTGLTLWHPVGDRLIEYVVPFAVDMRELTTTEIQHYVAMDQPLDCAGSFKWESLGISLFTAMHGEDPTALEGLPLIALCQGLRDLGYTLPPTS